MKRLIELIVQLIQAINRNTEEMQRFNDSLPYIKDKVAQGEVIAEAKQTEQKAKSSILKKIGQLNGMTHG